MTPGSVRLKNFDVVPEAVDHYYSNSKPSQKFGNSTNTTLYRKIMKEWRSLEKDLPESIYVQVYETRIDLLRAVIIGAQGTPYHNGLFFFDIYLPSNYPIKPPKLHYHSHRLHLNPNLYADGTVCLSLINTWYGSQKEMWTQNSTILQVLVSIQGLVVNEKPYFNEPAYKSVQHSDSWFWVKASASYNKNVFILSCKTMLYTIRNPPKNFENFVIEHFCNHADSILANFNACRDEHRSIKSNVIKIQSDLKKVFDMISEPFVDNSKKIEKVQKATLQFEQHFDYAVLILGFFLLMLFLTFALFLTHYLNNL